MEPKTIKNAAHMNYFLHGMRKLNGKKQETIFFPKRI